MNDEFLHRIRVRPHARFAKDLKMKLDQSSTRWEHSMSGYIDVSAPISSRSLALFAIVGLHVAFIFAFTSGLVQSITADKVIPMRVDFPKVVQPPIEEPAPLKPMLERIPIPVPKPPVSVEYIPEAPAGSEAPETPAPPYSGASAHDAGGSYVHAGLGRNFPDPDSFYPPSAIRQEIEGRALVRVCVGPDGKLAEAPQIAQSTRNRLLDEAALRLARAGSYVAGSRGGMAITDCFNFQTMFQIKDRR